MEKIAELLGSLGISEIEADVYVDLLVWRNSKANDIADRIKKHRSNVYEALKKLLERGFISKVTEEGIGLYTIGDPILLFNYIEDKEDALKEEILKVSNLKKNKEEKKASISYGVHNIQRVLSSILEQKKEILIETNPIEEAIEILGNRFIEEERIKSAKEQPFTKILYLKYFSGIENMVKQNNVEVRYLNEKNKSEIVNIICGDLTYFIVFKDPLTVIEIKESHIAEHFRNIFMLLWNNANQLKSGNE